MPSAHLRAEVVVADDDAIGGAEAAAHLRIALLHLDEAAGLYATTRLRAWVVRQEQLARSEFAVIARWQQLPSLGCSGAL